MGPFPSLASSAGAPPERGPLEPEGEYQRRLTMWRHANAKWAGQERALQRLDPPPPIGIPRAPWMTESEA